MPLRKTMSLSAGLIINSVRAIELESLKAIEAHPDMAGLTVHCVGPLLPEEKNGTNSTAQMVTEKSVHQWLDRQKENSVVYVSFGSVATPKPDQLKVIGEALLALGQPFIWSIREKYQVWDTDLLSLSMPD